MPAQADRIKAQQVAAQGKAQHLLVAVLGGAHALESTALDEVDAFHARALVEQRRVGAQLTQRQREAVAAGTHLPSRAEQPQQIGQAVRQRRIPGGSLRRESAHQVGSGCRGVHENSRVPARL